MGHQLTATVTEPVMALRIAVLTLGAFVSQVRIGSHNR